MTAAFAISFRGAFMFSLSPHYLIFLISLFLMGTGMAMLQITINPLLRVSGDEEHFAFNSVMAQLVFSGASFIAPQQNKRIHSILIIIYQSLFNFYPGKKLVGYKCN